MTSRSTSRSPVRLTGYWSSLRLGGTGSLWWATKNEWLGLLHVAGLRLEALYGGFAGEPLDDNSHQYVFVARL